MNDKEREGLKRLACDIFGHTWKMGFDGAKGSRRQPPVLMCSTCGKLGDIHD
jgi:hypothetical protein